jgi:hypothetical protein
MSVKCAWCYSDVIGILYTKNRQIVCRDCFVNDLEAQKIRHILGSIRKYQRRKEKHRRVEIDENL